MPPTPDASGLDAALIILAMLLVGMGLALLAFVQIPDKNLPIFASILTGIVSTVIAAYAGFRWGSSVTAKRLANIQGQGE